MTPQQIAILNSLVTFAAENVPGGLSEEERKVAQIVGEWATDDAPLDSPMRDEPSIRWFEHFSPPKAEDYYAD